MGLVRVQIRGLLGTVATVHDLHRQERDCTHIPRRGCKGMADLRSGLRRDSISGPAPEAGACARSTAALRSHAMTAAADRHLLFGLLALRNGLIDQVHLVAASQDWTRDEARSLADPLVARGNLDADACAGLEPPLSHPSS